VIGGTVVTGLLGPVNLELVQPTEGHWTAAEVLADRGECLYHLGFRTSGPEIPADTIVESQTLLFGAAPEGNASAE
jgi:hypothetical protein